MNTKPCPTILERLNMNITIEPTPELYNAPVNGVLVPVRIWKGKTSNDVEIEALVFTIIPNSHLDAEKISSVMPDFMAPSRQMYEIGDDQT